MFEVTVHASFDAWHALRNFHGKDEIPHSHSWHCEAVIGTQTLDSSGCAIDFGEVDGAIAKAIAPLANQKLNEIEIFASESPSAENMARHLYRALSSALDDSTRHVSRITVWEDDAHGATYYE